MKQLVSVILHYKRDLFSLNYLCHQNRHIESMSIVVQRKQVQTTPRCKYCM